MITKKENMNLYNRIRIINFLINRGGHSKTNVARGAGICQTDAYLLFDVMRDEKLIDVKQVARNSWITLNKKGMEFYNRYNELYEMIQIES